MTEVMMGMDAPQDVLVEMRLDIPVLEDLFLPQLHVNRSVEIQELFLARLVTMESQEMAEAVHQIVWESSLLLFVQEEAILRHPPAALNVGMEQYSLQKHVMMALKTGRDVIATVLAIWLATHVQEDLQLPQQSVTPSVETI